MFIQTEATPNPSTLKFLPGVEVYSPKDINDSDSNSTVFITSKIEAKKYRLTEELFEIEDIQAIMLGGNFISITKQEGADWEILKPQIYSVIIDHFTSGGNLEPTEFQGANNEDNEEPETTDPISLEIKAIIEEKVRPAVMQDGGNVIFKKFVDGVVYLKLQGACSGCPSASLTLKDGIENMLQYYIPEVQRVEQWEG